MSLWILTVVSAFAAPQPPMSTPIEVDGGSPAATPLDELVAAKRDARRLFVRTDWNREMAIRDRDTVIAERRAALDELRRLRREVRDARKEQRSALS